MISVYDSYIVCPDGNYIRAIQENAEKEDRA